LVLVSLVCGSAFARTQTSQGGTITKVVKLLQEMLDDSEADGLEDRDLFAKYKCYCDTNTLEKTKSIEELTEQIATLEGDIERLTASTAKLSTESAILQKEMQTNEAGRDSATSIREKENEDFVASEKDMVDAVDQMKRAIETLAAIGADQTEKAGLVATGSHRAGFMEPKDTEVDTREKNVTVATSVDPASMLKMSTSIKRALKAASIFLAPKEKKIMTGFLQAPFTGEYSAQSGEITGILKNMRDTFEANLKEARATEKKKAGLHGNYDETMTQAYDEAKESLDGKQEILSSNDDALATAKESLETASTTKTEDEAFLGALTEMCTLKQKEYEDRKMTRMNEEAAVAQAISILNTDAAIDSFGKVDATDSGATGFLQLSKSTSTKNVRAKVAAALKKTARKSQSLRIAKIAVLMESHSNPFDFVINEIKNQMVVIDKEEKADDDEKAWCDSERVNTDDLIETKTKNIDRLAGEIDSVIDEMDNPETGLKHTLEETQASLKENKEAQQTETEERQGENALYQKTVANLVSAESVLENAITVLTKFYDWLAKKDGAHHYVKHDGKDAGKGLRQLTEASVEDLEKACSEDPSCVAFSTSGWLKSSIPAEESEWYDSDDDDLYVKEFDSLLQTAAKKRVAAHAAKKEDPAPPDAEFEKGGQSEKGGDALKMLQFILHETVKEEETTHETEEGAQSAYEEEMERLTDEQNTFLDTIAETEATLAAKEKLREEKIVNHGETEKDKKAAERYLKSIKPGCDFMDENLDSRKETRRSEKSSLQEAIDEMAATPQYAQLANQDQLAAWEEKGCKDVCVDKGGDHVNCISCNEGSSPAGYCASHGGETRGCDEVAH